MDEHAVVINQLLVEIAQLKADRQDALERVFMLTNDLNQLQLRNQYLAERVDALEEAAEARRHDPADCHVCKANEAHRQETPYDQLDENFMRLSDTHSSDVEPS